MSFAPCQPPLITLTTDFGLTDTFVGVMKGVLLGIAPNAHLVDLTHAIAPQNIREASARLEYAVDAFPPGTIHLVVVDPGVGSSRAACIVETAACLFVAPDNGVLALPLARHPVVRAWRLTEAAQPYLRHPVSATFHGRDVFAPVAAHLANGLSPDALGAVCPSESLVTFPQSAPESTVDAAGRPILRVPILYADHFGNLITSLTRERWESWRRDANISEDEAARRVQVQVGTRQWQGLARAFADAEIGSPLAYWGSDGRLEIGIRDGNAARDLALTPGEVVLLTL